MHLKLSYFTKVSQSFLFKAVKGNLSWKNYSEQKSGTELYFLLLTPPNPHDHKMTTEGRMRNKINQPIIIPYIHISYS